MAQDLTDLLSAPATPSDALPAIPAVMNAEALARLMGVSEVTARSVAVKLPGRGRFDVAASLRAYLDRLREQAGRAGRPSAGGDEYKVERTRLAREQADKTALQNAALRGDLVPVEDVRREWATIATDLRASLLAIPARVAARSGLSREAASLLEDELRLAVEELTNER